MTAAHALMQAVLRDPADDLPRLIYADWLDEHGQSEIAMFIRWQIEISGHDDAYLAPWCARHKVEWASRAFDYPHGRINDWIRREMDVLPVGIEATYRRGFPSAISIPMARLMGGSECRNCGGAGDVLHPTHYRQPCKECGDGKTNGTGRTPALIDTIFSQWPVTEVRLTDREPWYEHGYGGEYCWWRESEWYSLSNDQTGNITDELFDKIAELHPDNRLSWGGPAHNQHIGFDSRDAAVLALSHAIVDLGRERAGLPAIRRGRS